MLHSPCSHSNRISTAKKWFVILNSIQGITTNITLTEPDSNFIPVNILQGETTNSLGPGHPVVWINTAHMPHRKLPTNKKTYVIISNFRHLLVVRHCSEALAQLSLPRKDFTSQSFLTTLNPDKLQNLLSACLSTKQTCLCSNTDKSTLLFLNLFLETFDFFQFPATDQEQCSSSMLLLPPRATEKSEWQYTGPVISPQRCFHLSES